MTKEAAKWSCISLFSKSDFHFLLFICVGLKTLSNFYINKHKYVQNHYKYRIYYFDSKVGSMYYINVFCVIIV